MSAALRAALVGAACAVASGAPAQGQAAYRCDGGVSVRATFPSAATAVLSLGGRTYRLKNTRAASGARYAGNGIVFWEHHGEATLQRGGKTLSCKAVS
jgi:membrane-bound inhibitor of C-type lysozyme